MSVPRIFVNIASYRDSECQWTIKDLFDKARYPDRIFVGICWQFVPDEDAACFQTLTRLEQCRTIEVHAHESQGVCWARAKTQQLWRGEEFTLQIDSHMRFVQDWDEILLGMLAQCPSPRAVLSTYPPAYVPPDKLDPPSIAVIFGSEFDSQGILKLHSRSVSIGDAPDRPTPNPFCAAGFLFAPAGIIESVPYDPYIYFLGEEITYAARLWTSGWDIFTPNRHVIWHAYTKDRRRHWHDNEWWGKLQNLSVQRILHLLGAGTAKDPAALHDIEKYGLGQVRSLAEYESFGKISFARRLIDGKDPGRIESETPLAERTKRIREIFTNIYLNNGWGNPETRSGNGSTLAQTVTVRAELLKIFQSLGIRVLADAGCGDLNWMSQISEGLRLYLGFDVVDELIQDLRRRFAARSGHFFTALDITAQTLPESDAIVCRDVLTHLPHGMVREALKLFKASQSGHLIATTHPRGRNDLIKIGGWQPLDLTAPPFELPPPSITIPEKLPGSAKSLGIWRMADLP